MPATLLSPARPPVLAFAERSADELSAFEGAVAKFLAALYRPWIHPPRGARLITLAEYLDACEGPEPPSGDEQSVVDELVRILLDFLGYGTGDWSYNRSLDIAEERAVPDFVVRVTEFAGTAPVFVIESKATSVRDFHSIARRRAERDETPLEQLRRYVLSGAVHGRTGILCNGFRLEVWEFGAEGPARLVGLDLRGLARAAATDSKDLEGVHLVALKALWDRYARSSFTRAQSMTEALKVPPLPQPWIARVNEELQNPEQVGGVERVLVAYHEEIWNEQALDVSRDPDALVASLRSLIEQFTEDVKHQLDDALVRAEEFGRKKKGEASHSDLDEHLKRIGLYAPNFNLPADGFEQLCLARLKGFRDRPQIDALKPVVASVLS